jgi:hypothetical protein
VTATSCDNQQVNTVYLLKGKQNAVHRIRSPKIRINPRTKRVLVTDFLIYLQKLVPRPKIQLRLEFLHGLKVGVAKDLIRSLLN